MSRFIGKKKIICITAGLMLSITAIVLPIALIFSRNNVTLVDLNLSSPLPSYYTIDHTQNGIQIKISDDYSNTYSIKKVILPDEKNVFEIEGDSSAIVTIKMHGDTFNFDIFDIENSSHDEHTNIPIDNNDSWILATIGLVKSFPKIESNYSSSKITLRISNYIPHDFILVNSGDGVYIIPISYKSISTIGDVFINNDSVLLPADSLLRTVHINSQHILTVVDLFDGYYKLSYSKYVDPSQLPSCIVNYIGTNPRFNTLNQEEFFTKYIQFISEFNGEALSNQVSFKINLANKNLFDTIDVLEMNGYVYMYSPESGYNIGSISIGNMMLYNYDPVSTTRYVLLKNVLNNWYIMVADLYPHLGIVNHGLFLLGQLKGMELFAANLDQLYRTKINQEKYQGTLNDNSITFSTDISDLKIISGSFFTPSFGFTKRLSLVQSSLTIDYYKIMSTTDLDLDNDELPPQIISLCGDIQILTAMDENFSSIGLVKWGNIVVKPQDMNLIRAVVVMHIHIGYVFIVVDFSSAFKITIHGIYHVPPNHPKWLKPLPVITAYDLKNTLSWASENLFDVAEQLLVNFESLITKQAKSSPELSSSPIVNPSLKGRLPSPTLIDFVVEKYPLNDVFDVAYNGSAMFIGLPRDLFSKFKIDKVKFKDEVLYVNNDGHDLVLEFILTSFGYLHLRIYKYRLGSDGKLTDNLDFLSSAKISDFVPKWYVPPRQ